MNRIALAARAVARLPSGPARRGAPAALLLAIVAVWGWTFVLVKEAIEEYGVVPFLAVRFTIASLCMGPLVRRRLRRRTLCVGGLIGLVLAASYLFQTFGLRTTTPTNGGLITGLFIVFTPLANRALFGVRTDRVLWGVVGTSVLGLILLTGMGPDPPTAGDLLVLGGAVCFGLHVALLDRHARHHDVTALAFAQMAAATAIFLAIWPFSGSCAWPSPRVWRAVLVTGVIATAAGFTVQTFVQQRLSAVQTAVIIATEPIFAGLFGYLLAGDRLTALQVAGAALMVGALLVAQIHRRPEQAPAPPGPAARRHGRAAPSLNGGAGDTHGRHR